MGIGSVLGAIGGIAGKILGSLSYVPTVISIVEAIARILGKAKMDGSAKHDLAIALVRQAILSAEGLGGKEILDEDKFAAGLDKIVHGTVDVMNAMGKDWGDALLK